MAELPIQRSFTDPRGIETVFYEWPVSKPRAVVQLVHGLGEHANRYTGVVMLLNRAGFSVYANDHRGHGRTGMKMLEQGKISRLGRLGIGGMKAVFAAEWRFAELIKNENPGVRHILMGQSWGSFIIQHVLNLHPADFDAIVLTGTTLMMPGYLSGGNFNKRFGKGANATGFEWLSRDHEVGKRFVDDEFTFPDSAIRAWGLRNTLAIPRLPSRRIPHDLPVLILVGDDDPIGGERGARALQNAYRRAGLANVELIVYRGGRHEMLNETNKDEVHADLLRWLNSVVN